MTSRFRLTVIYAVPDFDRWSAAASTAAQRSKSGTA